MLVQILTLLAKIDSIYHCMDKLNKSSIKLLFPAVGISD